MPPIGISIEQHSSPSTTTHGHSVSLIIPHGCSTWKLHESFIEMGRGWGNGVLKKWWWNKRCQISSGTKNGEGGGGLLLGYSYAFARFHITGYGH